MHGRLGASERLVNYLAGCEDLVALSADLSLMIATPDGGTRSLPFCLTMAIEAETGDETYAPILSMVYPLELSITVCTTLFIEATFDGSCDNRAWARANRYLLETVLRSAETVPGVSLVSWEADGFSDQVRRHGFANLSEEYLIFHLGHTATDLHYVKRHSDESRVIEINHFKADGTELTVHYRALQKLSLPVAAILVLEHFAPEAVGLVNSPIEIIQLQDIDSKRTRRFPM